MVSADHRMVSLAAGIGLAVECACLAYPGKIMNFYSAFHFLRPWWLLALPLFLLCAWWLARRHSRRGDWSGLIDPSLLPALRLDGNSGKSFRPWPLLALVWSL